jgi:Tol biopolymer transport system component
MDSTQSQEILDTEDATLPFWSHDSRSIGFFTETELKMWTIGGGPPQTLYSGVEIPKGGTWNQYGDILFSPKGGVGLYRISARGGQARPVTTLDASRGEVRHLFPQFLPDGSHFFYMVRSPRADSRSVYIGSLDSKDRKLILPELTPVRFMDPGHLLFVRNNKLMVQNFDKKSFGLTGDPVPIADNASSDVSGPNFSVSENNVLVYGDSDSWATQPIWFNRSGKRSSPLENYPSVLGEPGGYYFCDLSMDDKRLLTYRNGAMWMVDLRTGSFVRWAMTDESEAVFSPEGSQVIYENSGLYLRSSSGTGKAEFLFRPGFSVDDLRWSADGRFITFTNGFDLWALPLNGKRQPFCYFCTPEREESAVLSPDGKWFAYQSYQSGQSEIYVRSFPVEAGGVWAISTGGGEKPMWRRDGKELFYLTLDRKLMATEVQTGETFKPGVTKFLFQMHSEPRMNPNGIGKGKRYFASSDGKYFLVNTLINKTTPTQINVLLNWKSLLKK